MRGIRALVFLVLPLASLPLLADWPTWRGPKLNGISEEKNLPGEWGPRKNVLWRAPLEGVGTSTPVIWGDQVFLTMQVGKNPIVGLDRPPEGPDAKPAMDSDKVQFLVRSYNLMNGQLNWEYRLDAEGPLPSTHKKHNLASPSCTTNGKAVYAWMGTGQVVALTMDGKLIWRRHIGRDYAPFNVRWGAGSSPTLYKDSLLLLCDHVDIAYLLSLDANTGEERWKIDRGEARSYTTPYVVPDENGDQLVVNSTQRIDAYDPATGKLLWHVAEPRRVPVSSPVFHDGILYTSRGHRSGPFMAVRTGGRGDVNESHIIWRVRTGAPYVSSLLYYQGLLYMATENGIASCVDASNGKTLWKKRLGGWFSASPVGADGKVYLVNEDGEAWVLKAGRDFNLLHNNDLGERTLASPAFSRGRMLLRTDNHLVCIGNGG